MGFHMVKDLAEPRGWMAKIDLKDAYFLVPVKKDHQKFQWQGHTYQFHCLPFSLFCAPRTFTKLMKPPKGERHQTHNLSGLLYLGVLQK